MEELYRPTKDDFPKLVQTFVNAFFDYPLYFYAIPETAYRKKKLQAFFKMMVRYGVKFGDMYAFSKNIEGIAIYIHPESGPMTTWRWIQCGMLGLMCLNGSAVQKRYNKAIAAIEPLKTKYAPSPSIFLFFLAVDPELQHQGIGSKLVKTMLERLAKENKACYLETFKAKNETIYNHMGFKTMEKYPVPGTDLTMISLLWLPSKE